MDHLARWIVEDIEDKTGQKLELKEEWHYNEIPENLPRQNNNDDCGIFTIMCVFLFWCGSLFHPLDPASHTAGLPTLWVSECPPISTTRTSTPCA